MKEPLSTPAAPLHKPRLYPIAVMCAAVITAVTVALLFFLDKIIDAVIVQDNGKFGVVVLLIGAVAGVFSLPYLLRIAVSPLMRVASFVAMFVGVLVWITCAILFGEMVPGGVFAPVAVGVLAVISAWIIGLPRVGLKNSR